MLITVDTPGQLGNRLQLFANVLAYALEHKHSLVVLSFSEYAHFFKGTLNGIYDFGEIQVIVPKPKQSLVYRRFWKLVLKSLDKTPWIAKSLKITEIKALEFPVLLLCDPTYQEMVSHSKISLLRGYYYYDHESLTKHSDTIRKFFQPLDKYQKNIERTISQAREKGDILVGIHIRHGDFATYEAGKYFFSFKMYENFMQHINSLFSKQQVHFLVCSNTDLSAITFSSEISWQPGPGTLIEDMYSLAKCDYILGPFPSTFSAWSAFYGKVKICIIRDSNAKFTLEDFHLVESLGVPHLLE